MTPLQFERMCKRIISAFVLLVFLLGSMAPGYAKSKVATTSSQTVIKDASGVTNDVVFVKDAIVIDIPVNHIGYYDFAYTLDAGVTDPVIPVAHAPPNTNI